MTVITSLGIVLKYSCACGVVGAVGPNRMSHSRFTRRVSISASLVSSPILVDSLQQQVQVR